MDILDNLAKYKIFLSAAECGSISKAAAQLYITQPAVSITIKKLEESLGTTLFLRKSKGIALTENGKLLYDSVKQAFHLLSDTEQILKSSESTGHLRIASSNVLCKYFLMPYLKAFTHHYPNTDVSITCTSSSNACSMLEKCEIDLALAARPDNLGKLQYHSLGLITYIFVCTSAYRNKFDCRDDEIFRYANILLPNKDNGSRTHIDNYFAKNNIVPSHILEVNDMDLLIEFAKMGIGISCVVKQFVEHELSTSSLMELDPVKPVSPREIGFLYHNIRPFNDNILKFINTELE